MLVNPVRQLRGDRPRAEFAAVLGITNAGLKDFEQWMAEDVSLSLVNRLVEHSAQLGLDPARVARVRDDYSVARLHALQHLEAPILVGGLFWDWARELCALHEVSFSPNATARVLMLAPSVISVRGFPVKMPKPLRRALGAIYRDPDAASRLEWQPVPMR